MVRVIIWTQHRVEATAGAALHDTQEFALLRAAGPAVLHADAPPVGQHEAADVYCIGTGVGAAAACASDIATGEAAHCLDAGQG